MEKCPVINYGTVPRYQLWNSYLVFNYRVVVVLEHGTNNFTCFNKMTIIFYCFLKKWVLKLVFFSLCYKNTCKVNLYNLLFVNYHANIMIINKILFKIKFAFVMRITTLNGFREFAIAKIFYHGKRCLPCQIFSLFSIVSMQCRTF
jgi:hypothetical protein